MPAKQALDIRKESKRKIKTKDRATDNAYMQKGMNRKSINSIRVTAATWEFLKREGI